MAYGESDAGARCYCFRRREDCRPTDCAQTSLKAGFSRMDELDHQFALSYGPEDAFMLHRYHCPPRSLSERPGAASSSQTVKPLDRPVTDDDCEQGPPDRGRELRRFVVSLGAAAGLLSRRSS